MNKHNLIPSLLLALLLIAATVLIGFIPDHESAAYPSPVTRTPEPTCVPPSPDYPEPCHEHGGPMIVVEPIYLPLIEK